MMQKCLISKTHCYIEQKSAFRAFYAYIMLRHNGTNADFL